MLSVEGLSCVVADEKYLIFINEIYNENIDSLHGVSKSYDEWKKLIGETNAIYYIVSADEPVAWFRLDLMEDELWLGLLLVKPIYQRKGVGKYVLSLIESIAREKGLKKIGIHATEDNIAAKSLYLSSGYKIVETSECTTGDGKERMGYTFEKNIND